MSREAEPALSEWQITICTECRALTQDDRDYGGPFPRHPDDCPREKRCGTFRGRQGTGSIITCPGEQTITVVEPGAPTEGVPQVTRDSIVCQIKALREDLKYLEAKLADMASDEFRLDSLGDLKTYIFRAVHGSPSMMISRAGSRNAYGYSHKEFRALRDWLSAHLDREQPDETPMHFGL